ncbi:MAG: hypothetical protein ACAH88_01010 [Roseimicrobium sp.]
MNAARETREHLGNAELLPADPLKEGFENHKEALLVGAGVLVAVMLISAVILVFIVRRMKRRHDAGAQGTVLPGSAPRSSVAGPSRLESIRGARAFPGRTAEGSTSPPARSGDTARLTAHEEPLSTKRGREAPSPPLQAPPRGSIGTIVAAWGCLIAGLCLMMGTPGSYAICIPLFLIAFLLAVMAMTQGRILHGSLMLAVLYLAVPGVWLAQHLGRDEEKGSLAAQAQVGPKASKSAGIAEQPETSVPVPSPSAPPAVGPDPYSSEPNPAMPRLLVPDDSALPSLTPSTTLPAQPKEAVVPSLPVANLPPLPPKAEGALFSYRARLSHADHINESGTDLRTLARTKFSEILLQERLHVHQGARREPEDSVDGEFEVRPLPEYRSLFEGKPLRLPKSISLIELLKDDVIVDIQVFEKFIQVDPVSVRQNP